MGSPVVAVSRRTDIASNFVIFAVKD